MAGGVSDIWMQLCVNEIPQHKLVLTSGAFISVLFFLTPLHAPMTQGETVGRHNRNQRKEQGIDHYQGAARLQPMIFGMLCRKPRCIDIYPTWMSNVKYKRIYLT